MTVEAVIFDLDGVLLDSEQRWNEAKEALVREAGGTWRDEAPEVMMGMSSPEWSAYLREDLQVPLEQDAINREVVRRMEEGYRDGLPLLPGAGDTVRAIAARWLLGLASSSNRELIDLFLELADFGDAFQVTVSSEEVAARQARAGRLPAGGREARRGPGARRRHRGLQQRHPGGRRGGMPVIAVPNPHYPPAEDALALAAASVSGVADISPDLVESAARWPKPRRS